MRLHVVFAAAISCLILTFFGCSGGGGGGGGNSVVAVPRAGLVKVEELTAPDIEIAAGSDLIVAGTGMVTQPATLSISIPQNVEVKQALLYWQGRGQSVGADTIVVDGQEIQGELIGETDPALDPPSLAFRADVTSLGLVSSGSNELTLEGVDFTLRTDGAALLVIVDDGVGTADIQIRDGMDFAFIRAPGAANVTTPQEFILPGVEDDRSAEIIVIIGDGTPDRPDELELTLNQSTTVLCNEARGREGAELDIIRIPVELGASPTTATLELFSRECGGGVPAGLPDSISWFVGAVIIPPPPVPPSVVGDTVFCDANNNGSQEESEEGIAGVTVELRCAGEDQTIGTEDDLVATQVTDASGKYLFENVPPGLCEVIADASTAPGNKVPGDNCPDSFGISLAAGESFLDADFCFKFRPGEVGDTVYCDLNDSGTQEDGEPGVPGVEVELVCALADGGQFTDSTTTDASGLYLFSEVPPAECEVSIDPNAVPDKELGRCPASFRVTVEPGGRVLDADFCLRQVNASVGDLVYCDVNNNGAHDEDEPGIEGVEVMIACAGTDGTLGTDDDFMATTTTAADGSYLFEDVPPGVCQVSVPSRNPPDGKVVGECPTEITVQLKPLQAERGVDFCYANPSPGEIGDLVFCDKNGDGALDPGEPGIGGVTINLRCAGEDGALDTEDDLVASTETDGEGKYLFADLDADLCVVTVDVETAPEEKTLGACPTQHEVELTAGGSILDADFCFENQDGEIGDTVFCDLNNNGTQEEGEPGIAGVRVDLKCVGADGSELSDSIETDESGQYLFTDLPALSECVVAVDIESPALEGKSPGECPTTHEVVLQPAQSYLVADFCFVSPGSIGDTVFCDDNDDGVQDEGEAGIAGVTVRLTCSGADGIIGSEDDVERSTTTDEDGKYLFDGLEADLCDVDVDATTVDGKTPGRCSTTFMVDLEPGQSFLDADFCFVAKELAGCTPGFWKQEHHFPAWRDPYTPDTLFSDVFDDAFPGMTLLEVLRQGGGGLIALGRHTVAALLNGANEDVNYGISDADVIELFNDVYPGEKADYEALKNDLVSRNERGCTTNGKQ